ncbi:MAG: DUF4278 domain-containing protein [Synechococcales cyanobacterium T60_A2020_003]|nr:DUF4278 domain-containing protein [Synechococcales cyanobacterium T60_A2020_003]
MTLTYRGQTYTPSYTTIEAPKVPLFGTYRGRTYSFTAPQPAELATEEMTYRGITYNKRPGEKMINSRQTMQLRRKCQHPAFNG